MSEEIVPLPVGAVAPDFTLTDALSGETYSLSSLAGRIVVLDFWSGECPWSRQYDDYFIERAPKWAEQGIILLHIDSNADETPADIDEMAEEIGISAPILHDAGNAVADAYGAVTTPQVFVIGADGRLAYRGAVDDRSFRQREATVNYLDAALAALLAGQMPDPAETQPYGCAIMRQYDD
jgi:peroxiredoxin